MNNLIFGCKKIHPIQRSFDIVIITWIILAFISHLKLSVFISQNLKLYQLLLCVLTQITTLKNIIHSKWVRVHHSDLNYIFISLKWNIFLKIDDMYDTSCICSNQQEFHCCVKLELLSIKNFYCLYNCLYWPLVWLICSRYD